jgi:hypothetical protein
METKIKTCTKGINKAKGFNGCGNSTMKLTYGLCNSCLWDFYHNDERGKVIYQKSFLPKVNLKLKSFQKQKTKEMKENVKTKSDYEKELQKEINTIVRLIDKDQVCISTLKPLNTKFDAGHFYSCGSTPSLRFNLNNIFAQSVYANQYLSGDQINFLSGLSQLYGENYKEYVLNLKSVYKELKLHIYEIKDKIKIAREIVKELKEQNEVYDADTRRFLRNIYNLRIGIYLD